MMSWRRRDCRNGGGGTDNTFTWMAEGAMAAALWGPIEIDFRPCLHHRACTKYQKVAWLITRYLTILIILPVLKRQLSVRQSCK